MKYVLLVGSFGARNIGDELILDSALDEYKNAVVVTANKKASQKFCERDFSCIKPLPAGFRSLIAWTSDPLYRKDWNNASKHIDTIVFPGGGLFAISFIACFYWFLTFLWLKHFFPKAKIIFQHQGVDKGMGFFSRLLAGYVLKRADSITVRDTASVQAVYQVTGRMVEDKGDRVEKYLDSKKIKTGSNILINAVKKFDGTKIRKKYGEKIKFIAFAPKDLYACRVSLQANAHFPKTKSELFDIFGSSKMIIGERFHSIVLGKYLLGKENTKVLRKPYSEKVKSFSRKWNIRRA